MNAPGEKTINAIEISTKRAQSDKGLHAEGGGGDTSPGAAVDVATSIEEDDACHKEYGPRELVDALRRQHNEKTRIEREGEHHHIHGKQG